MNKGSTKLLVIVGLIALLACSWYMMFSETAKVQAEYDLHLSAAREKYAAGLHELALEEFVQAQAIQDSIALRDEMAQVYLDFGVRSAYEEFCGMIIEDYPYENLGYERLANYYVNNEEYSMFFSIKESADKRKIESAAIKETAQKLAFEYSLENINIVDVGGACGGYFATLRNKGLWGLLNERGGAALAFNYVKLSNFANGVIYAETQGGEYVLIDRTGKVMSRVADDRIIEDCSALNAGKIAVKYNGKYHYCDENFKELFGSYDYAGVFNEGVAAVMNAGKWALINEKGEAITEFIYDDIKLDDVAVAFRGGRAFAKKGNTYILIDGQGKQIGNGSWDDVDAWNKDKIAAVKKGDKWGFVDIDGNEAVACQYQGAKSFYNGMAAVQIGDKWGYIHSSDFSLKIEAIFAEARDFTAKGTAFVREKTQWQILQLYRLA